MKMDALKYYGIWRYCANGHTVNTVLIFSLYGDSFCMHWWRHESEWYEAEILCRTKMQRKCFYLSECCFCTENTVQTLRWSLQSDTFLLVWKSARNQNPSTMSQKHFKRIIQSIEMWFLLTQFKHGLLPLLQLQLLLLLLFVPICWTVALYFFFFV